MRLLKRSIVLVLLALAGPGHAATRAEFPGGWYAEILPRPNAQSVVLIGNSHLESSVAGRVDLPNGQNVLFTRIGPGCFGGQGHVDGGGWVWNGGWSNRGIAHGVSPLIFRPGTCDPLIATPAQGSQGYRFIDDAGRAWTGDETYADRVNQIWEWTRRGNIACGQGPEHGYHCLIDGRRVQIVEGFVWFTRFNRAGDELAFAWVAPREGYAGTLLMTVAELDALPTYVIPGTVPPPPPPPPPPPERLSCASFTRRGRPPISRPSRARMAASAARASSISTNAKPRARPVSRSVMMFTDAISPWASNRLLSSASVAEKGRFPTYSFLFKRSSSSLPAAGAVDATLLEVSTGPSGATTPSEQDHQEGIRANHGFRSR
jgi:hypothetical protein